MNIPGHNGRLRFLDISKEKFGLLKPLEVIAKTKNGTLWRCKCDCGNETTALTGKLKIGHKKSCGCLIDFRRRTRIQLTGKDNPRWTGYEEISGALWNRIKASARKRNIEFCITKEYAWDLFISQNRKCALSGVVLEFAQTEKELHLGTNTASIDRIDNNIGYIENNIQWVHPIINYMKHILNQDEFISWCKLVAQKNKSIYE